MTDRPAHPQTIALRARPGDLLKRGYGPIRPRMVENAHDEAYLKLVRDCPCIKCGLDPSGEAAHIRMSSGVRHKRGGIGKKPADCWALPVCRSCHQTDPDAIHKIGELAFFDALGIDALLSCERLYAKRGDLPAMRAATFTIIAEREASSQSVGSTNVARPRP